LHLPTPRPLNNHGNYIISLGQLCRWLAKQAEQLGVNIFPGFAASKLIEHDGEIRGIITGHIGLDKAGKETDKFQHGIDIYAKQTILAEGCRGSLTQQVFKKYDLRKNAQPQTYGLGIKELWEVDSAEYQQGTVIHTVGWPLDKKTYGGSFVYHLDNNKVALGFVVGLDYQNPYLDPYEECQRLKTHPKFKNLLANGRCLSYGARALNEGGYQAIPDLVFPGGLLIGCGAGFLDVVKIKGIHNAMKSGMVAAENITPYLKEFGDECFEYPKKLKKTWVHKELYLSRNIRPGFYKGLWRGLLNAAFDTYFCFGRAPWTYKLHDDFSQLKPANESEKINYPKHDGKLTFDKLSAVFQANIQHREDQPVHLMVDKQQAEAAKTFARPEQIYCPSGVYEIVNDQLQINASNCLHCKACEIKDPGQHITWTTPEGGSGPNYKMM